MKRNKLVMIFLLIFLCAFSIGYESVLAIYKEKLNTKVYLSVLDPSSTVVVSFDNNTDMYVYVGGQGSGSNNSTAAGGFNGGGQGLGRNDGWGASGRRRWN